MNARILVTGAQGLVGRFVAGAALDAGHSVIGCGRSPARRDFVHTLRFAGMQVSAPLPDILGMINDHPRYRYRSVELGSDAVDTVLRDEAPDLVVHAAGSLRGTSTADLMASNLLGTSGLLEALPAGQRVVVVSSGSVYGRCASSDLPLHETTTCRPADRYGVTKRAAEDLAWVIARERGLRLSVARVFNVVGPGLQDRHLPSAIAGQLAAIRLGRTAPELRVGSLHATRDFVDVRDVARSVLAIGISGNGCYNVASGVETSVADVVEQLIHICGQHVRRVFTEESERPTTTQLSHGIDRAVADVGRLVALGVPPKIRLESSLRALFDYYLKQVAGGSVQPASVDASDANTS